MRWLARASGAHIMSETHRRALARRSPRSRHTRRVLTEAVWRRVDPDVRRPSHRSRDAAAAARAHRDARCRAVARDDSRQGHRVPVAGAGCGAREAAPFRFHLSREPGARRRRRSSPQATICASLLRSCRATSRRSRARSSKASGNGQRSFTADRCSMASFCRTPKSSGDGWKPSGTASLARTRGHSRR